MSDNGGDIGAFMAGFVLGGLVGAATAFILAPQSGAETRAQIAAKGDEWRIAGEEQLHEYRTLAETRIGEVRGRVEDTSGAVQEKARIVLDEGKSRVSRKDKEVQDNLEGTTSEVIDDAATEGDVSG